jgi:UDP-N-acetyl-D-glucosamine dehydrogenase
MPHYWVQKVQDVLNDAGKALRGSHVLVLGVAYKKNVSDTRESPALDILHLLHEKGSRICYHDPLVPSVVYDDMVLESETDLDAALCACDCCIIVTDHSSYDWARVRQQAPLLVDTRRVIRE